MAFSSVFYSENTRLTVQHVDVSCLNLGRLFKLQPDTIYLVSDENRATLPEDGKFMAIELSATTHYRVMGNPVCPPPLPAQATTPRPDAVPYRTGAIAGPSTATHLHGMQPKASAGKVFKRKILLATFDERGRALKSDRTIYITLRAGDYNVPSVKEKIMEELGIQEEMLLLDANNMQLSDTLSTRERAFWVIPSRIMKAVTATDYESYKESARKPKKLKLSDTADALLEVEDTLLALVDAASTAASADRVSVVLPCSITDIRKLQDAFACIICKDGVVNPVVSACCKSLLGCQVCLESWWENSPQCPKCRAEDSEIQAIRVKGLDAAFKLLRPLTKV